MRVVMLNTGRIRKPAVNLILIAFFLLCATIPATGQDTTRLSLLFFGDIMQHDSQIADAFDPSTGSYNYDPCFEYVKPYLESADVAIGNLELTLAGPPYKGYPQFSAPDELLVTLKKIGTDVLVTANNHCVDRGRHGLERTIQVLDSFGIVHTGTFSEEVERLNLSPLIIEKNGFRLALLNYTYGTNGLPVYKPNIVNMLDTAQMRIDIARAKTMLPDVIIVFTHWGTEYQNMPSAAQKMIAKFCLDQGVHIVIGAHPHVLQPMEWNKDAGTVVVYSLGNFVSGQRKRYTDGGAMAAIGLRKVSFPDGRSITTIDTAGYLLQWVYRDAGKNYFILPVGDAEEILVRKSGDEEAMAALQTFIADSRSLLGAHNLRMSELKEFPFYSKAARNSADTRGDNESAFDYRKNLPSSDEKPSNKILQDSSRRENKSGSNNRRQRPNRAP